LYFLNEDPSREFLGQISIQGWKGGSAEEFFDSDYTGIVSRCGERLASDSDFGYLPLIRWALP